MSRLKKDNHLKSSSIRPGQVLKGPRNDHQSLYGALRGHPGRRRPAVRRHDRRAARRPTACGAAQLHAGQKLFLPAGYRDRRRPRAGRAGRACAAPRSTFTAADGGENATVHRRRPAALHPAGARRAPSRRSGHAGGRPAAGAPTRPRRPPTPRSRELGRGRFHVAARRARSSPTSAPRRRVQRNDGINIQADAGDPVRAAAAGDVVYAGDQVPGFGNLVLIKHADGWVTAYGHLSTIDVKMQQKVTPGPGDRPGRHRPAASPSRSCTSRSATPPNPLDRARPVDPKLVLPK